MIRVSERSHKTLSSNSITSLRANNFVCGGRGGGGICFFQTKNSSSCYVKVRAKFNMLQNGQQPLPTFLIALITQASIEAIYTSILFKTKLPTCLKMFVEKLCIPNSSVVCHLSIFTYLFYISIMHFLAYIWSLKWNFTNVSWTVFKINPLVF